MNKFRNEKVIKLGSEDILLRPTFENISAMESHVGGLSWFAYRFGMGVGVNKLKHMPTLTECAAIIYHNQAATKADDPTQKKFSLNEIWDLLQDTGIGVVKDITEYISQIAAGNKKIEALTEAEKKS